jgi:predicted nucleotidyltransferase
VSQSVIAAYEGDSREPALSTLAALVEATGFSLEVGVGAPLARAAPEAVGPIGRRLRRRRAAVVALAAMHGLGDLGLFGCVARGEDGPDSDLDLMVRLPEGAGLFAIGRFAEELEELLGVRVDVVPEGTLKKRVQARVEPELMAL